MLQKINNPLESCQLKLASDGKGVFEGYASVFNKIDSYGDTILPGAFAETIKAKRKPSMFINHDSWNIPVGDWMKLSEDSTGLLVEGKIDLNHRDGTTVYSALQRKAMDGLSIGFRIPAGGAEENEDSGARIISKIDLKEISIVNFPADDNARISIVKSNIQQIETLKDAEILLRDAGYSRSEAKFFVSQVGRAYQRDAGRMDDEKAKKLTDELYKYL
ncbi:MAG: HK97 family phage prohead protease [Anaerolineae bacterium]|nr:HK97 family phage prohead protease [Anaerolineae bacterium]